MDSIPLEILGEILNVIIERKDHRSFFNFALVCKRFFKLGLALDARVKFTRVHRFLCKTSCESHLSEITMWPNGIPHGPHTVTTIGLSQLDNSPFKDTWENIRGKKHGWRKYSGRYHKFHRYYINGKLTYVENFDSNGDMCEYYHVMPDMSAGMLYSNKYQEWIFLHINGEKECQFCGCMRLGGDCEISYLEN
jgi:hypothetical protein